MRAQQPRRRRLVEWSAAATAGCAIRAADRERRIDDASHTLKRGVGTAVEPGVHDVRITLWRDDTILHVEVTDDGVPFDPMTYELPAAPRDLESAPIGGLGIKLMRSFADGIAYRRCGAMNRLTLSFLIAEPVPKQIGGLEPARCGDRAVHGCRGDL